MKLERLFQNKINHLASHNNELAVAVSGGIDSVVLLHLITNWTKKCHYPLPIVLTVNHGIRLESSQDAQFIIHYAKEFGVQKALILEWQGQNIKNNIQAQARDARYQLLIGWCKNNNIKQLFIAHHKDDQAETFLLRLERGSGLDGLSSMNYKSLCNGIYIIRPLLDFSRNNIEEYALYYNLKWREDKSNLDVKYKRTLYRKLLHISSNQKMLTDRICLTALHARRAIKALKYYLNIEFNKHVLLHDLGYIAIKLSAFDQLPEEMSLRILVYSIMIIGNALYKPRFDSINKIFSKILQKDSNLTCTLSGCKIKKYREYILILREISKIKSIVLTVPVTESVIWDNRFQCSILGNISECSVTLAPLGQITRTLPKYLRESYDCHHEVIFTLPVVMLDTKIIAYPQIICTKQDMTGNHCHCIIDSIIKQNLVTLIGI
ncbi:tRNA lysidine(34) synthetase TilS [Wolbachia endosymbiont of Howardula sp.]|uniref:tRNA lysidine(34) synthetase TilS n=1 Tax=Wolbachia endosymbiont of Howardula sp. TaxID=2916816 RepID=UPI00217DAA7E|nr:tRNA lysidine(34) synthetase TilS [Wolbachia endosymbiont of Howardula sp.]UWI83268.1 tRNA lysidine(34) synthetase TilS [Wolbachia endosymbiont of Howardula sp.]